MQLEVKHLQLIEAITTEGSVTRAADRLNVTQSALSHQLREIEQRLRTPLFLRVNRRLALAPAGERLLASARRVLEELRTAEDDIEKLAMNQTGTIRLSTECYTCYHWLPPLLKTFNDRFPGVEIQIRPNVTRTTLAALLERTIDFALVHQVRRDRRLSLIPLFEDEIMVIMPADHPYAKRRFVQPRDLQDVTLIMHSDPDESFFARRLAAAGVRPKKYSRVILTEAIVEMVRAGLGMSAMPRWIIEREIKAGGIAAVRFTRGGLRRKWFGAVLRSPGLEEPVNYLSSLIRQRWSAR